MAVSLGNGFPLWYWDGTFLADGRPLKLQLCLDPRVQLAPALAVNPCEYEPPLFGAPPSFPGNFGAEAIYWLAAALGNFTSTGGLDNAALLVLALEAAGADEAALTDGNQAVFSRIRLRIDLPIAGTYRVTHPFGARDYVVSTPGGRAIDQTQTIGISAAQNFLLALQNGSAPVAPPAPTPPSADIGLVNGDGAAIGPFLVPANPHGGFFDGQDPATFAGGPITADGATYIGFPLSSDPANPANPIEVFQPVGGSPFAPDGGAPANHFRIELIADAAGNPPGADGSFNGFYLNAVAGSQVVRFDDFITIGKLFDDGANLPPHAADDLVATAVNRPIDIDVVGNDIDLTGEDAAGNAHDIDPQAIAVIDPATGEPFRNLSGMPRLTATLPTEMGGTVRRITNLATGKATFLYTPPVDFVGFDTFSYVVQDRGGLISAPAQVGITVEELRLDRADYRPRLGKWHLRGTSSDRLANRVTLFAGPRARLMPELGGQTPAVFSAARGTAVLRVSDSTVDFLLDVDPLPATAVTAAHIQVGAAGDGPIIFTLYESVFGIPFSSPHTGALTAFNLQARPEAGIASFSDATEAILGGNAYVTLRTTAFPAGEIRGRLQRSVVGSAAVIDGVWEFNGHSTAAPDVLHGITVESANGVRVLGGVLRWR